MRKNAHFSTFKVVVSVARKYAGYGLPLVDLIQEGNLGLMKAVKSLILKKGLDWLLLPYIGLNRNPRICSKIGKLLNYHKSST